MSYQDHFANQLSMHLPVGWVIETSLKNQRGFELYIVVMHAVTGFIIHDITFASTDWQALKASAKWHIIEFVAENFISHEFIADTQTQKGLDILKRAKKAYEITVPLFGKRHCPQLGIVFI